MAVHKTKFEELNNIIASVGEKDPTTGLINEVRMTGGPLKYVALGGKKASGKVKSFIDKYQSGRPQRQVNQKHIN